MSFRVEHAFTGYGKSPLLRVLCQATTLQAAEKSVFERFVSGHNSN